LPIGAGIFPAFVLVAISPLNRLAKVRMSSVSWPFRDERKLCHISSETYSCEWVVDRIFGVARQLPHLTCGIKQLSHPR
jgi:hypothetical protein